MALDVLQQRLLRAERSDHTRRHHPAVRDHAAQRDYTGTLANDYTACDHTALVGPRTGTRPDTIMQAQRSARAITGTSPADAIRFGPSNTAPTRGTGSGSS